MTDLICDKGKKICVVLYARSVIAARTDKQVRLDQIDTDDVLRRRRPLMCEAEDHHSAHATSKKHVRVIFIQKRRPLFSIKALKYDAGDASYIAPTRLSPTTFMPCGNP